LSMALNAAVKIGPAVSSFAADANALHHGSGLTSPPHIRLWRDEIYAPSGELTSESFNTLSTRG